MDRTFYNKLFDNLLNKNLVFELKIIVSDLTCRNIHFYNRYDEKSYLNKRISKHQKMLKYMRTKYPVEY